MARQTETAAGEVIRVNPAQQVRSTFWLGIRELRTAIRMPAYFFPNLILPIFFFFVMVASIERLAGQAGFANYKAFQLPASIVIAVMSGGAGLNMVLDIESGYFDKLMLTPVSRWGVLVGSMGAEFVRIFLQGLLVLAVAFATGIEFATGLFGGIVMVFIASFWGFSYSGIGFSIALKTGNSQATQGIWALFLPFFFLAPVFGPLETMTGWLKTTATYNPLTYVLRSLRSLSLTGWDSGELLIGLIAAGGLGVITLTTALLAMRGRIGSS